MASFEIDFEWPVAAAYEALPPAPQNRPAKRKTILEEALGDPKAGWRYRAKGATKLARPLDRGDLYLSIMKMQMEPQSVLHVVQQVGFLDRREPPSELEESLDKWRELQTILLELERLSQPAEHLSPVPLGNVTAVLQNGASANAIISFQPRDLRTAIILQCTQALISGCVIRACEGCGKWFEAGGHSGRRADATFHDEACRTRTKNSRNAGKRRARG